MAAWGWQQSAAIAAAIKIRATEDVVLSPSNAASPGLRVETAEYIGLPERPASGRWGARSRTLP